MDRHNDIRCQIFHYSETNLDSEITDSHVKHQDPFQSQGLLGDLTESHVRLWKYLRLPCWANNLSVKEVRTTSCVQKRPLFFYIVLFCANRGVHLVVSLANTINFLPLLASNGTTSVYVLLVGKSGHMWIIASLKIPLIVNSLNSWLNLWPYVGSEESIASKSCWWPFTHINFHHRRLWDKFQELLVSSPPPGLLVFDFFVMIDFWGSLGLLLTGVVGCGPVLIQATLLCAWVVSVLDLLSSVPVPYFLTCSETILGPSSAYDLFLIGFSFLN